MTSPTAALGPIVTFALYAQAIPAIAYILSRRKSRPAAFIALGGLITVLSALIGVEVARVYRNNLVVGFVAIPLTAGAYILALAEWQTTYVEKLTMRIGLGMFIAIYVFLVMRLESVTHFGQYSHTLYSIVLLAASLWTLGRRALTQDDYLAIETDWFWVGFGLAMYGAATAVTAAIGNILMARDRIDLFVQAWNVRGALVILAFLAVSWGVFHGPARASHLDLRS